MRGLSPYTLALGGNWPHCPFEAWARGGGRPVSVKPFHHNLGTHRAVPRLLVLCALVALPGIASCQNAAHVVPEEASVTAGASTRLSLPRPPTPPPNARAGDRET